MKTLYDQYPTAVAALVDEFPNITEMMRYFMSSVDMAESLGFVGGGSGVNHWLRGGNVPGRRSEKFAKMWLEQHQKPPAPVYDDAPAKPATKPAATGAVLMVICPDGMKDRAIKLLSVIGCEAVEI